jgi:peptidoglycan/LPS O-acetylase OafA/YrhL
MAVEAAVGVLPSVQPAVLARPAVVRRPVRAHVPALDGVRGLAILMVMCAHFIESSAHTWTDKLILKPINAGWVGVDLFFVLSGYLITGILVDSRGRSRYFSSFYARRFLRIFPLYYGVLILYIIVLPRLPYISSGVYARLVEQQAWFWTYLSNVILIKDGSVQRGWSHFWSLAVEEQFYLLWPTVVLIFSRRQLIKICVGCLIVAELARIVLYGIGVNPWVVYFSSLTRMDGIAAGAMLALIVRGPTPVERISAVARPIIWASASVVGAVFIARQAFFPQDSMVHLFALSPLATGFASILALAVLQPAGFFGRVFSHRALRFWGTYSYGLYVLHRTAETITASFGFEARNFPLWHGSEIPRFTLIVVGNLSVSLVLALASWHLFERPILGLKRFFEYEQPAERAA